MSAVVRVGAGLVAASAAGTVGLILMIGTALGGATVAAAAPPPSCTPAGAAALDPEQTLDAGIIIAVGTKMGVASGGIEVALITAVTESGLHNLTYGSADSVGLFQQRPSQGWGSVAQILDPAYAAGRFYTALLAVPSWATLAPGVAAQDVQRSAFPDRYASHIPLALQILGTAAPCAPGGGPGTIAPGPSGLTLDGSAAGNAAATFALAQLGKPYVWGATGPASFDCSGLMMAAWAAAGVTIPRVTYTQATAGTPVPLSAARTGDLVLIPGSDGSTANPGHVGMVAGTDKAGVVWLVEASRPGVPIRLTAITDWANQIVTIRRIG